MQIQFTKTIENTQKLDTELRALTQKYQYLNQKGDLLTLTFEPALVQAEVDAVSGLVNNFVEVSVVDLLRIYMETKVVPFISNMKYQMLAENISMGISQAGKTADVLGLFNTDIVLPGSSRPVTFKQTLDEGSLTVTVQLLQYFIDHPELYSDLSPFVTVDRLTIIKNKIIAFLQISPY
jgi:hypothetical protein